MSPEGFASLVPPNYAQDVASVLLVNGDADEARMYRDCLESALADYVVDIRDFPNVVERAEATAPDVIVTDLALPSRTPECRSVHIDVGPKLGAHGAALNEDAPPQGVPHSRWFLAIVEKGRSRKGLFEGRRGLCVRRWNE
jgi:hypothetical protein